MWPNSQETSDLVIFNEEILNGELHFLYSAGPMAVVVAVAKVLISFVSSSNNQWRCFAIFEPGILFKTCCKTNQKLLEIFRETIKHLIPKSFFKTNFLLDVSWNIQRNFPLKYLAIFSNLFNYMFACVFFSTL